MKRAFVMAFFCAMGCGTMWFFNFTWELIKLYLVSSSPEYHDPVVGWFLLGFTLVDALIVVIWFALLEER